MARGARIVAQLVDKDPRVFCAGIVGLERRLGGAPDVRELPVRIARFMYARLL